MRNNELGTWDYFYRHASGSEMDAVTAAKRLDWCGDTQEERDTVAEATAILAKYDLL